jgi:hypothetical protein
MVPGERSYIDHKATETAAALHNGVTVYADTDVLRVNDLIEAPFPDISTLMQK